MSVLPMMIFGGGGLLVLISIYEPFIIFSVHGPTVCQESPSLEADKTLSTLL